MALSYVPFLVYNTIDITIALLRTRSRKLMNWQTFLYLILTCFTVMIKDYLGDERTL